MGFYRHAAVLKLNAEQNAGLTLPAIVHVIGDGADRIKRQLAENMERENQSPMDKAVAIKRLLDAGVPKPEIRRLFSSSGGRKGNTVQPMSNAMLNILVRLLDLPKTIQEKIHDGRVGVEAAYLLGKVHRTSGQLFWRRLKRARLAQIEQEEKDEQKYLDTERKATEAEAKATEAQTEAEKAKADVQAADEMVAARKNELKTIKNGVLAMDEPAGQKETEAIKAAEANVKAAEKVKKEALVKLTKLQTTVKTAQELAVEKRLELEAARKAVTGKKKVKAVGKEDVKKAAASEGTAVQGAVALSASDMRATLKDFINGKEGADDRVVNVAKVFKDLFDGKDTPKESVRNLTHLLDAMGASVAALRKTVATAKATTTEEAPATTTPPEPKVKKQPVQPTA
jgi:hypothetical protein